MSDIITAECPHCLATLRVKGEGSVGKKARCPKCKEPFVVKPKAEDDDFEEETPQEEEQADNEDDFMKMLNTAVTDSSKRQAVPRATRTKKSSAFKEVGEKSVKPKREVEDDGGGGVLANLGIFGWILGGLIGGLVGAAVWTAIGVSTGYEVGYVAWGVGLLVGFGVRFAAQESYGAAPGVTAVLIALFSVTLGKFLIAYFFMQQQVAEAKEAFAPEKIAIAEYEEQVTDEFDKAGREWTFGKKKGPLEYTTEEVEAEAKKRWDALPDATRQEKLAVATDTGERIEVMGDNAAMAIGVIAVFIALMISPLNLLWFGFPGYTAFRIGSGASSD